MFGSELGYARGLTNVDTETGQSYRERVVQQSSPARSFFQIIV
jgi:hypothetical protein